jgi:hypothetical protein
VPKEIVAPLQQLLVCSCVQLIPTKYSVQQP